MGVRSRALARNEAIWSRFTGSLGQYRLLVGGLHPLVTPAVPSRSMSVSWTLPSSSVNRSSSAPATKNRARQSPLPSLGCSCARATRANRAAGISVAKMGDHAVFRHGLRLTGILRTLEEGAKWLPSTATTTSPPSCSSTT